MPGHMDGASENESPDAGAPAAPAAAGSKPPCAPADALAVLRTLRAAGCQALFAGGCVRDQLLGLTPKDWDVATDAPPAKVREIFPRTQAVGAAFGVILVRHHKSVVEVATFRADAEYADGRHPTSVRFTDARHDAQRRDFTINGLFLDPLHPGPLEAQVIDYVGGQADLHNRVVRAIGDAGARFNEDHLRMLRAVRFAARFNFSVEPGTAQAIQRHARHIVRISPERVAEELRLILCPPTRGAGYQLLDELELRTPIFRFLDIPKGEGVADRSKSVLALLPTDKAISFGLALAAMALDEYLWGGPPQADARRLFEKPVAQKVVRAFRQSLKISNDESDDLLGAFTGLDPLLNEAMPTTALLKRFLARATSCLSRDLLAALDQLGRLDHARVAWLAERLTQLSASDFAPPPLLSGDDLTAAGLSPGPAFKRILDAVYDAQLEDRISSKSAALEMGLALAAGK